MATKLSSIINSQSSGGSNVIVITETRDPLASDSASLGDIWINTSTNRFFICTDATTGNTVWESGAGGEAIATDTRDPNSSDLGNLGSMWINTVTDKFFICTDDTPGATVWGSDTQIDVLLDTVDPTVSNSGHPLGTFWINTATTRLFFCVDNSSGAALWRSTVEVIDSLVDPTMDDYAYPLGTIWINAVNYNQKTYFVLIDNTTDKAIWSKNETDVYWVTDPTITGSVIVECDETHYTYDASDSLSSIDEATTITYHWSCTGGVLMSSVGASIDLYFTNAEKDSVQVLSCYAEDDLGNISETRDYPLNVEDVNLVDNLVLSLPNKIITTESSFFDVTVGYTGGDHTLNYYWESSADGSVWTSVFFVDPNIKFSEAIFTSTGVTYIRCTVTNLAGSVTETSAALPTIDTVSDADSTYLDTILHTLENKDYSALMVSPSVISVPTIIFEQNDRIIVNDNQDNVSNVTNVFDNQLNMVTDKTLLNDDYTSYTTTCTLMGNKVLVAYNNSNVSPNGVIRVGTFNGDSISFGDEVIFNNNYAQYINVEFLVDNKVIIAYRNDGNNNLGGCKIGTVTGDTIDFSAEFVFNSVDTDHINICKVDDAKFAVVYSDFGTGNLGTVVIGSVSGNTISFGTKQVYANSTYFNSVSLIDTDKIAICYQDDTNSNYGSIIIAGVSGTNLALGSSAVFSSNGNTNFINVVTIGTNKIAICYQDVGVSGHGFVIVGDVVATTVTFGTAQLFENTNTTYLSSMFDNNRLFVSFKDGSNFGKFTFGSIAGTVVTFNTTVTFNAYTTDFISLYQFGNKIVVSFKDGGDADKGKMMVYTPYYQELTLENETVTGDVDIVRLNTAYVLPIIAQQPAQEVFEKVEMRVQTTRNNIFTVTEDAGKAVYENYEIEPYVVGDRLLLKGDSDVYSVITQIDRAVVSGTGVSVAGFEDIFNNNNTQQTSVASLENFVVCAFRDNSSTGAVVLGEVKYDNVYYGSKLTFLNNDVDYVSVAKIADNKVVICFQDKADNSGNILVAKVTDEVLSIHNVYQFSAGNIEYIDVAMVDTDKFIISYQDVADLNKGKCILGTVSNTTISLGSEIEFSAGNTTHTSVCAISTTKIAIAFRDIDNSGFGTVRVGNIVGLGITFGSNQVFYSGSATYTGIELLSASKVIIKFTDVTNGNYGSVIVGVVSGTGIAYGVSAYFNSNTTHYSSVITTEDDTFMIVYDNYTGNRAYSKVGLVSTNVISLDSAVEINNSTTSHIDTTKINQNKIVMTYSDLGNSYKGTSQIVRRDFDLLRSTIHVNDTIPTNIATVELLSYFLEASSGSVQSFDSTEYYHTDLDETFSVLNATTLLTTATVMTSGNYFYSRLKSTNTDEFDKYVTRIDIDFWTQP